MNTIATRPVLLAVWPMAQALRSKKLCLRVNRTLAWALVVSPILQIMLGSRLVPGLLLDLAILLVHGGLSIWLFGVPKAKESSTAREAAWMRWAGMPEQGMSPRNRFLLSGWRIALSSAYLTAAPFVFALGMVINVFPLAAIALAIGAMLMFIVFSIYSFMWPYAVITHVYGATGYALRRWGANNMSSDDIAALGFTVALVVMASNVVNLFRPLWS
jgi:hypothetical protein